VTDTLENVKWGSEFEGEFVFNFNKKFGVGLGVEYIRRTNDSLAAIEFGALTRLSLSWEPVYTAIPIKLSGYYRLPFGSNMNAYVKAGVGYYFARIAYTTRQAEEFLGIAIYEQQDGQAKDNGLGFHGGLGWEIRVAQNVAFFVEGTGRYVNLKDWNVKNTTTSSLGEYNETGKFWYAEEYNPESGKFYASLFLFRKSRTIRGLGMLEKLRSAYPELL
jgi:opacity protein-like surface antigen